MNEIERNHLVKILARLSQEHRDLKMAIISISQTEQTEPIKVQKLKNRRDQIKQVIEQLTEKLTPDIIA